MAESRMSDDDLLVLIGREEKSALGSPIAAGAVIGTMYASAAQEMTTLQVDRYNALNAYWARPMGNEVEGQSAVVIPVIRDSLEWIAAQLMRVFDDARTPAVFEAEDEGDIQLAELETEGVRHVFMSENDGHTIIQDYIKDALLLRNGYIKVWWDPTAVTVRERYTGLTQEEVTDLIANRDEVEILEQRERQVDMPASPDAPPAQPPVAPNAQPPSMPQVSAPGAGNESPAAPLTVFDITIRVKKADGRLRMACIAPEDVLVSNKATSANLDDVPFVEHKSTMTRSELISQGYEKDFVDKLVPGKREWLDIDALARDIVADQLSIPEMSESERASQEIEVRDVILRVDYDRDGLTELRHICVTGDKIADNEEIEECPIASGCAKRMPHRHTGISLYDDLQDLQAINSQLARESLNNLRLANNARTVVDWKNCNLTDLMTSRAGGVVRVNGQPRAVVEAMQHPSNLTDQVLPMFEQLDKWREFRLGIGRDTLGLDPDALQDVTATAHLAGLSSATLKLEMMARCLAEGLRDAMIKARNLLVRHQKQPLFFKLRGKFQKVDPQSWKPDRSAIAVNVGLGSGNRPEQRQNLMLLQQGMEKAAAVGLVGPKQVYNAFQRWATMLGEDQPEQFVMDPDSQEFKQWMAQHPPQPNPAVVAAQTRLQATQVQAQAGLQKAQIQEQGASQRAQAEVLHGALQGSEDRGVDMANIDSQVTRDLLKIIAQIVAAQYKQDPNANAGQVLRSDLASLEGRA